MAAAVPSAPYLLSDADAVAIAEAAAAPNDYGRYYEEFDDDDEVRVCALLARLELCSRCCYDL